MPAIAGSDDAYPAQTLPADGHGSLTYWLSAIKDSEEKRNTYKEKDWDRNVQAYLGKTLSHAPTHDTVTVPKDFANVERKKAELFFQNPDVNLTAKQPGLEEAVQTFQAVLNYHLGPEGVDAGALMIECTFDACMTGLLCSCIGYESFQQGTVPMQVGEEPDPNAEPLQALPGAVLDINAPPPAPPMIPVMQAVPNIVFERYFWERLSPAKMLLPTDFHGFNYDAAPWLGYEFEDDWAIVKKRYGLSDDLKPKMGKGDAANQLKSEREDQRSTTDKVRGWVIWYRTNLYDPQVAHPEAMRYLVLIDGLEEPVKHTDSPYQRTQPDGSIIGMMGFPVHIGAVRYVSDTAYPAAETSIGRPQVLELGKSRTQMLMQRDRNAPMRLVDSARMGGEEGLAKIRRNEWQGVIPVVGLDANNPPIIPVTQAPYPPEDFQFNSIISRDLDEIWAFSANQRGTETQERKTATEIRNIQSNVSSRMDYERRQVIRFFVGGAEKLGALLQLFADNTDFVHIVGPDGVKKLQPWNKELIAGEFVYDARPDSAVRMDAAQEFRDMIELYNLAGRDPHVNRVEILMKLARLKNLDVTRFITPELPPKGPEPVKASLAIKGEQLDPRSPNFPILLELLKQSGFEISPQALQNAQQQAILQDQLMMTAGSGGGVVGQPTGQGKPGQPTHPGPAPQMERLSKHNSDRSNELSGPSSKIK